MAFDADIKTEAIRGIIRVCIERRRLFRIVGAIRIRKWIDVCGSGRVNRPSSGSEMRLCTSLSSRRGFPRRNVIYVP